MRSMVYENVGRTSVRLSVRCIIRSPHAAGRFAAERPADRRYRSIAGAGARSNRATARRTAANADSVMLTAELTRLNTDTLICLLIPIFSPLTFRAIDCSGIVAGFAK